MRIFTLIFALLILLLGISFAVMNADLVTIKYYFGIAHMPLSLLLVIALIIGVLLGLATTLFMFFKAKAGQHYLRKQLQSAEKELDNLRKFPLNEK